MSKHNITATINGDETEFACGSDQTLLEVLRNELQLTGTKNGCGTGDCAGSRA
jgi:carbon-monoxide dehydrogenase small subunit